jgi:hypothetical protein
LWEKGRDRISEGIGNYEEKLNFHNNKGGIKMTEKYQVVFEGHNLALAYVSPHPEYTGHKIVSLIPISRKGKWENNNLTITFESPVHSIFPELISSEEAIRELLAEAAIEDWKCKIYKSTL